MAVMVVLGLGGCATVPPCPARGGPAWRQFTSAHFNVRTDLDVEQAKDVIATLEETRATMLTQVWGGAPGPSEPTQVIAFASAAELSAFAGFGVDGVYLRRSPFPPVMVIEGAAFAQVDSLRHELAHDLSTWFLPFQPAWFSEGIATFLETARYDRASGRGIVGEPGSARARAIQRYGVLQKAVLLGPYPTNVSDLGFFESSSWALVHYLLNHRLEAFQRFQRRIGAMESAGRAWQAEFPDLDDDTLYATLVGYVQSGDYVVSYQRLPPWTGQIAVRTLADAEVHGIRAYLYAFLEAPETGTKPGEASAEIQEAVRGDPGALEALAVAFYAPDLRKAAGPGLPLASTELASRASRAHPESWLAWLMVADSVSSDDPISRNAVARAMQLAPGQREVLARMAAIKASTGDWQAALALSGKALRGGMVNDSLWLLYLAALANTGRCADAERWETAVVAYLPAARAQRLSAKWNQLRKRCVATPPVPATESR